MSSRGHLPSRFHEFGRRNGLLGEGETVVVAVSGGVDSMVLLDLLARERGLSLIVAHFNHMLRGGESDGDEAFVAGRATHYGAPFHADRADTAAEAQRMGLGIQEAARDMRYAFFRRLQATTGAGRIATAHHADDNAETILLHLFRGTGVPGMAGIPLARDGIIRPLLFAQREEIEGFAREENIPFRTDSSNAKDGYTRNAIRHHVLPLLKDLVTPSVVENINRSGDHFRALADYIAREAGKTMPACVTRHEGGELRLSIPHLTPLPLLLRQCVAIAALEEVSGLRPASERVDAVLGLAGSEPGSRVTLPGGTEVSRERDQLVLRRVGERGAFSIRVEPGREYRMKGFTFASRYVEHRGPADGRGVEFIDADAIAGRVLTLRTWRNGDAFIPLGMRGRKKISDFFIDAKIPLHDKNRFPVLETVDGEVVWVCGQRLDDRFKVTSATRRVLQLEFITDDRS